MRKLVIAVIFFSFLGFGPLKSFFQNEKSTNGTSIIQTIRDSSGLNEDGKKAKVFIVTEENSGQTSKETALLLRYDSNKKKLLVGDISLPPFKSKESLVSIKKTVEKNYHVSVDHVFSFNHSGIAHMIDLLAPNGIPLGEGPNKKKYTGEEVVLLLEKNSDNQNNQDELKALFSSFKNEIVNKQSAEKWLSIAPSLINEAYKNVDTDLGKGELLSLGITALMNPITTIEPINIKENEQSVNSQTSEGLAPMLYN